MDEWLDALKNECKRKSQSTVAKELGYSASTINQVLKGSYKGDMKRFQRVVEGTYLNQKVDCPVIGEIPKNRCEEHQSRKGKFAATNPLRVTLHRTCPTCPNANGGQS